LPRALGRSTEASAIAAQHLGVGEQVVPQRQTWARCKCVVPWQQRARVLARPPREREARAIDRRDELDRRAARVEAQVRRDLIVAAARRVQRRAGSPTSSMRRDSTFMWTSSSPDPACARARSNSPTTWSSPFVIASASAALMRPHDASMRA